MNHLKSKQPTLKTWLRANGKFEFSSTMNFQNRRVRELQIQEAIKHPQWFSF